MIAQRCGAPPRRSSDSQLTGTAEGGRARTRSLRRRRHRASIASAALNDARSTILAEGRLQDLAMLGFRRAAVPGRAPLERSHDLLPDIAHDQLAHLVTSDSDDSSHVHRGAVGGRDADGDQPPRRERLQGRQVRAGETESIEVVLDRRDEARGVRDQLFDLPRVVWGVIELGIAGGRLRARQGDEVDAGCPEGALRPDYGRAGRAGRASWEARCPGGRSSPSRPSRPPAAPGRRPGEAAPLRRPSAHVRRRGPRARREATRPPAQATWPRS